MVNPNSGAEPSVVDGNDNTEILRQKGATDNNVVAQLLAHHKAQHELFMQHMKDVTQMFLNTLNNGFGKNGGEKSQNTGSPMEVKNPTPMKVVTPTPMKVVTPMEGETPAKVGIFQGSDGVDVLPPMKSDSPIILRKTNPTLDAQKTNEKEGNKVGPSEDGDVSMDLDVIQRKMETTIGEHTWKSFRPMLEIPHLISIDEEYLLSKDFRRSKLFVDFVKVRVCLFNYKTRKKCGN